MGSGVTSATNHQTKKFKHVFPASLLSNWKPESEPEKIFSGRSGVVKRVCRTEPPDQRMHRGCEAFCVPFGTKSEWNYCAEPKNDSANLNPFQRCLPRIPWGLSRRWFWYRFRFSIQNKSGLFNIQRCPASFYKSDARRCKIIHEKWMWFTNFPNKNGRISTSRLNALLRLHLKPINVVIFHGPHNDS
jgi:hypothetical protein